jgi:hypothetical protein
MVQFVHIPEVDGDHLRMRRTDKAEKLKTPSGEEQGQIEPQSGIYTFSMLKILLT